MALQPRMEYGSDLWMLLQPARHLQGVAVVLFHANRKRLDPAQHEEAVLRPRAGAHGILQKTDFLRKLGILHDDRPADNVRVAVDVLGGRMHHNVHAQLERPLKVRREERVVADGKSAVFVCQVRDRTKVHQVHQWICGGFDPDGFRPLGQRGAQFRRVAQIDVVRPDLFGPKDGLEQTVRAAIEVVVHDDAVTRLEHHE